jgi:hypothetical protein
VLLVVALSLWGATAAAEIVTLANGDQLDVEVVERLDDGSMIVRHPQLGKLELESQMLEQPDDTRRPRPSLGPGDALGTRDRSSPDGEPSEEEEEEEAPVEGEEEKEPFWQPWSGFLGTPLLRGWDNNFGVGLSGSEGGFEDTKLSFLFSTGIQNESRRWLVDSYYFYNVTPTSDGNDHRISKNQANLLVRRDWLRIPGETLRDWLRMPGEPWNHWFGFAQSRYQFDDFQRWKQRIAAHVGPGYHALRDRKTRYFGTWTVDIRLGLGLSHSFGSFGRTAGEGMLGFKIEWSIKEWLKIATDNELYLDLTESGRYRSVQSMNFDFDIGEPKGLGWRLSLLYNHDTESEGKENDLTYLSSLTWEF